MIYISQSYGDLLNYSDSSLEIQKVPLSSGIFYDILIIFI